VSAKLLTTLSGLALAVAIGVGIATFRYAEGLSYLSSDPAACANCHIMWPQYESWQKSSHKSVAGCVDCHLPHDFIGKYLAKAENGWNHSRAFTLQNFREPISVHAKNAAILQESCLYCHGDFVHAQVGDRAAAAPRCVHCHATVGHGEPVGLGGPLRELPKIGDPS
jgi:cytochrome c nitrite reductase small subunit